MPSTVFDIDTPVAIMTFNLKNAQDIASWDERKSLLTSVIRDAQPLFIGTQEGYETQLAYICEQLPGYVFIGESRCSSPEDEFSAIFFDTSRVTLYESSTQWLSATPHAPGSAFPGEVLPRIVTWAICGFEAHDRPLMVVNSHLTYEPDGVPAQLNVLL